MLLFTVLGDHGFHFGCYLHHFVIIGFMFCCYLQRSVIMKFVFAVICNTLATFLHFLGVLKIERLIVIFNRIGIFNAREKHKKVNEASQIAAKINFKITKCCK